MYLSMVTQAIILISTINNIHPERMCVRVCVCVCECVFVCARVCLCVRGIGVTMAVI